MSRRPVVPNVIFVTASFMKRLVDIHEYYFHRGHESIKTEKINIKEHEMLKELCEYAIKESVRGSGFLHDSRYVRLRKIDVKHNVTHCSRGRKTQSPTQGVFYPRLVYVKISIVSDTGEWNWTFRFATKPTYTKR